MESHAIQKPDRPVWVLPTYLGHPRLRFLRVAVAIWERRTPLNRSVSLQPVSALDEDHYYFALAKGFIGSHVSLLNSWLRRAKQLSLVNKTPLLTVRPVLDRHHQIR